MFSFIDSPCNTSSHVMHPNSKKTLKPKKSARSECYFYVKNKKKLDFYVFHGCEKYA